MIFLLVLLLASMAPLTAGGAPGPAAVPCDAVGSPPEPRSRGPPRTSGAIRPADGRNTHRSVRSIRSRNIAFHQPTCRRPGSTPTDP